MAPRRSSLKARASSIIRSPLATIQQGRVHEGSKEKDEAAHQSINEKQDRIEPLRSSSSGGYSYHSGHSNAAAHDRESQRLVRSIPTWVHTQEDLEDSLIPGLPSFPTPSDAYLAQHNSSPSSQRNLASSLRNLVHQEKEWVPPWPGATIEDTTSRWKAFKTATAYPRISPNGGQMVSADWWQENGPDYDQPWLAGREEASSEDGTMAYRHGIRRKAWYQRLERYILRSPIIPMVIRMLVMSLSIIALGLAASIWHLSNNTDRFGQVASTTMAIVVDTVAIVYLCYITYDEYSGKPLGLRPARAKIRLIFLDLFFIVFASANLSLAFVARRETKCQVQHNIALDGRQCSQDDADIFQQVARRQKALESVLLIVLIAWLLTFAISIAR